MLDIKDLSFTYPRGEVIFNNFSHSISSAGIIHITGPNGRGKTTLLKLIAGLITVSRGEIHYNGKPITVDDCSYMPAQPESSFLQLNGRETLDFFCSLNGTKYSDIGSIESLLKLDSFQKAIQTRQIFCSTGMKQIINFTRCLVKDAPILLLDEPFKGLDQESRQALTTIIESLNTHKTILVTGHEELPLKVDKVISLSSTGGTHA